MRTLGLLIFLLLVSGCTQTANIVEHPSLEQIDDRDEVHLPNTTATVLPVMSDPCTDVVCTASVITCPDGTETSCSNICVNGVCTACIPNCIAHMDPCAEVTCPQSSKQCKGGTIATCENTCVEGVCPTCIPLCPPRLEITEIMYNPPGSDSYTEWIELTNPGNDPIDVSQWTLCGDPILGGYVDHADGEVKSDTGTTIQPHEIVLLTDGGSGTEVAPTGRMMHVDASSLCGGLANTDDIIILNGEERIRVAYSNEAGANGNGNSLHWTTTSWEEGEPTPSLL